MINSTNGHHHKYVINAGRPTYFPLLMILVIQDPLDDELHKYSMEVTTGTKFIK